MKTKLIISLFALCAFTAATAQDNTGVYDYFNARIDEAVSAATVVKDAGAEDANHVYARLFSSPVLYNSVIKGACAGKDAAMESDIKAMDDERESVIENMLVDLYRTAPSMVQMTEEELRSEKSVPAQEVTVSAPLLDFKKLDIPTDVTGGMKTTVTKPNYWKFSGRTSLTFTQNFISENWYQGGESNYAMLATIDLDMNYNDNDRISWTNHFDLDLGFATSQADTLHSFRTNTDKLRLESTFGYKIVKSLDLAAKLKVESQMLPNYPVNTHDFISNCLAPLDANASIGFNFKPNLGNFKLEVFLAPLSAYNFRYVHYNRLAGSLGINDNNGFDLGRGRARQDFGTQLVVTVPTYQLTSFLDVYSRLEYYTDYHRSFFQWETKFNAALSKYFTASLMLNARFDDSVAMHKDWKLWQFKELFTLGVAYSW
jgi:hypothetical protein